MSTKFFLGVLCTLILTGCNATTSSSSPDAPKVSFIHDKHLFAPGPEGGVDRIMLGEGMRDLTDLRLTLSQYEQIMIDPITVSYSDQYRASYDNLENNELEILGEQFRVAFADAVRDRYPLVTSRFAPNTVRLSVALTGVGNISGRPGYYNMSSASIEAVLKDARSGQLLVAIIDSRGGKYDLKIPEDHSQNATNAFSWWAQRLRHLMDTSRL